MRTAELNHSGTSTLDPFSLRSTDMLPLDNNSTYIHLSWLHETKLFFRVGTFPVLFDARVLTLGPGLFRRFRRCSLRTLPNYCDDGVLTCSRICHGQRHWYTWPTCRVSRNLSELPLLRPAPSTQVKTAILCDQASCSFGKDLCPARTVSCCTPLTKENSSSCSLQQVVSFLLCIGHAMAGRSGAADRTDSLKLYPSVAHAARAQYEGESGHASRTYPFPQKIIPDEPFMVLCKPLCRYRSLGSAA